MLSSRPRQGTRGYTGHGISLICSAPPGSAVSNEAIHYHFERKCAQYQALRHAAPIQLVLCLLCAVYLVFTLDYFSLTNLLSQVGLPTS
jgi:hypothetical protein